MPAHARQRGGDRENEAEREAGLEAECQSDVNVAESTKTQRHRGTEAQRHRGTETQRSVISCGESPLDGN